MSQLIDNLNIIESVKTDIKSAIEAKGVDMTGISFPGYASKIGEITTSFVTVPLNVSANGTYTPRQGIDGYSQVVVDVPQSVTGITEKEVTEGVQIVNLSNSASYVHPFVFEKDNYLQTVYLPNCTNVGGNAFAYCNNLTTVNLSVCSELEMNVFIYCEKLVSFYGPSVSIIGQKCFDYCINLSSVYIPLCNHIELSGFRNCYALTSIDLPEVVTLQASAFMNCSNLSYINIPKISSVKTALFKNCTSLTTVLLGSLNSSVIPLDNSNAFTGTPIASGTGSIYVPASLVDAYKSATNWSYFSTQIFPIE